MSTDNVNNNSKELYQHSLYLVYLGECWDLDLRQHVFCVFELLNKEGIGCNLMVLQAVI